VEDLDPVRFLSNRASGKLGFAVARAALRAGHRVILIHGPVEETLVRSLPKRTPRLTRAAVRSAAQMERAVRRFLPKAEVVVMSAAVADFTPLKSSAAKWKKRAGLRVLRLKPTVDILAFLGRRQAARRTPLALIGFALESGRGKTPAARERSRVREARRKLKAKNLDAIVLDDPSAMGAERGTFQILRAAQDEARMVRETKSALARRLVKLGEALWENL